MPNLLILAALPEEAESLFPNVGTSAAAPIPLRRLTAHGHALTIVTCGLGKVNAALVVGLFGANADLILMTGTCGALGAAPGAYWIAEALQHDYGAAHPGAFRRYRAGDWPIGEAGEAHFAAMPDPGLGLPRAHRQRRQLRRLPASRGGLASARRDAGRYGGRRGGAGGSATGEALGGDQGGDRRRQ